MSRIVYVNGEYLPEEDVDEARFQAILAGIRDPGLHEAVELTRLACIRQACPTERG